MTNIRQNMRRLLLLAAFGALACVRASAQGPTIILDPPVVAPVSQLNLTDIYVNTFATNQWLFTIGMRTSDGSTVQARMSLRIQARLASGESYDNAVQITTRDPHFSIPGSRSVTNVDLGRTIPVEAAVIDAEARRTFERVALPTGRLPAGTYRFYVDVVPLAGGVGGNTDFTITISNPSSLTLLFPPTGDESVGPTPLFQWFYDGPRSKLSVFERVTNTQSLEEAASGVPMLQETVTGGTFLYPAGGTRPLLAGHTYVWYVEGLSDAAGGTAVAFRSEIRTFTVSKAGLNSLAELLDQLEQALGQKHANLFATIRSSLLQPNGDFRINGAVANLDEVQKLVEQIRKNPDGVVSVTLE